MDQKISSRTRSPSPHYSHSTSSEEQSSHKLNSYKSENTSQNQEEASQQNIFFKALENISNFDGYVSEGVHRAMMNDLISIFTAAHHDEYYKSATKLLEYYHGAVITGATAKESVYFYAALNIAIFLTKKDVYFLFVEVPELLGFIDYIDDPKALNDWFEQQNYLEDKSNLEDAIRNYKKYKADFIDDFPTFLGSIDIENDVSESDVTIQKPRLPKPITFEHVDSDNLRPADPNRSFLDDSIASGYSEDGDRIEEEIEEEDLPKRSSTPIPTTYTAKRAFPGDDRSKHN